MSNTQYLTEGMTCRFCGRIHVTLLDMTNRSMQPSQPAPLLHHTASSHVFERKQSVVRNGSVLTRGKTVSETNQREPSQFSRTSPSRHNQLARKGSSTSAHNAKPLKSILRAPRQYPSVPSTGHVYATVLDLRGRPILLENSPPILRRTASGHLFEANPLTLKRPEIEGPRPCSISVFSKATIVEYVLPVSREGPAKLVEVTRRPGGKDAELSKRSYAAIIEHGSTEVMGEVETRQEEVQKAKKSGKRARKGRPVSEDVWMQIASD